MNPMLNIAIRAARKAGNVIAKNYERRDDIQTSKKGINDYVTSVDKAAEAEIIEIIQKSYPDHTIISEERGALEGKDSDIQWVIDPLDGTTNFVKGLPHFSVSIAIRVKNRTEVGVVYDPIPVSYTHLDVYKRQAKLAPASTQTEFTCFLPNSVINISKS